MDPMNQTEYHLQNDAWVREWVSELSRGDRLATERATTLLKANTPKNLYRYRSLNNGQAGTSPEKTKIELELACIEKGEVYLCPACDFNDPLDSIPTISRDLAQKILARVPSVDIVVRFQSFLEDVGKTKLPLPISTLADDGMVWDWFHKFIIRENCHAIGAFVPMACFSTEPASMVMWSHYADSHRGICLEYDTNKCAENCDFRPIVYAKERYLWDFLMKKLLLDDRGIDSINECQGCVELAFGWKSIEWAYEKEWRLVGIPDKWLTDDFIEDKDIPKGTTAFIRPSRVILGATISNADETKVRTVCGRISVPVAKASLSVKDFTISW